MATNTPKRTVSDILIYWILLVIGIPSSVALVLMGLGLAGKILWLLIQKGWTAI